MGLWGDDGVSLGGVFEGGISGGRVRLKINLPGPLDIPLVDQAFKRGGQIGQSRADASRTRLNALHAEKGPTAEQVAARRAGGVVPRRAGGRDAPDDRAEASRAKLNALHARRGPTRGQAAEARGRGDLAPAPRRMASNGRERALVPAGAPRAVKAAAASTDGHALVGASAGKMAHPLATGPMRKRHEIAPGVACPSCAAGITTPVA